MANPVTQRQASPPSASLLACKLLQGGSNTQKQDVEPLKNPQRRAASSEQPKRTEQWDASPHCSERRSTRKKRTILLPGMEPRQEFGAIKRAIAFSACHVHELNRAARIETPDQ